MSEQYLGSLPSGHSSDDAILLERRGFEPPRRRATDKTADSSGVLTRFEQEQLARDIADIERATAALQRAEPALASWIKPETPAVNQSRPLWLLISALWLSTALITAGAIAAIASFAG